MFSASKKALIVFLALTASSEAARFPPGTLLVLSFSQDGCEYCERLERSWADQAVVRRCENRVSRSLIDTQKGLEAYNITITPTTIVYRIDAEGKAVRLRRAEGYMTPKALLEFLNDAP